MKAPAALPNLIVIGAQKCGTSALHAYLAAHPEISMSRPKELDFFLEKRNWGRGVEWYAGKFDAAKRVRGEASPNYTNFPMWPGVPERMAAVVPDARLVYLVRDPIERIGAQWMHNWAARREDGAIADVLGLPNRSYLGRSRYMWQLEQFLQFFPPEQLLVLDQDELRRNRADALRRVFVYVGVDPDFTHRSFDAEVHVTQHKVRPSALAVRLDNRVRRSELLRRWIPKNAFARLDRRLPRAPIPRPDVRSALPPGALEMLSDDAARLREFTGLPLMTWSV